MKLILTLIENIIIYLKNKNFYFFSHIAIIIGGIVGIYFWISLMLFSFAFMESKGIELILWGGFIVCFTVFFLIIFKYLKLKRTKEQIFLYKFSKNQKISLILYFLLITFVPIFFRIYLHLKN